jgi:hypothetical protein
MLAASFCSAQGMLEARFKLAKSHARAVAGGQAYAAKMALRQASGQPEADPKPAKTQKQAPSQTPSRPEATPQAGSEQAHLTLTLKNSLSTRAKVLHQRQVSTEESVVLTKPSKT